MKMCFDCMDEVVYTDNFAFAKVPTSEGRLALVLKSEIGKHVLGVYSSDMEFTRALQDVQQKTENVLQGMYGNKIVHIFANTSYENKVRLKELYLV